MSTPWSTARAALSEAHGDLEAAAAGYADAAERWQAFGVVAEQAFGLLGQGRCLIGPGRTSELARFSIRLVRSSRSSRQPLPSPRPTSSCSRRPRSARRGNEAQAPLPLARRSGVGASFRGETEVGDHRKPGDTAEPPPALAVPSRRFDSDLPNVLYPSRRERAR